MNLRDLTLLMVDIKTVDHPSPESNPNPTAPLTQAVTPQFQPPAALVPAVPRQIPKREPPQDPDTLFADLP